MKKRIFSIFTAVAMILCLAGCQKGVDSEQAKQTNGKIVEMKTIDPPEDGWTLEQLNEVLYMNDQKIELPLMFSSLEDGYEIRDKEYKYEDTTGKVGGYLYYKDEFIALITFYEEEADIEILTMLFLPSLYEPEQDISSYININGFGLKSKFNDLYNTLGNGFTTESGIFLYKIKNSNYIISIPEMENDFSFFFYQDSNEE